MTRGAVQRALIPLYAQSPKAVLNHAQHAAPQKHVSDPFQSWNQGCLILSVLAVSLIFLFIFLHCQMNGMTFSMFSFSQLFFTVFIHFNARAPILVYVIIDGQQ